MKPLKLKMKGFGPYLKPVEIDFTELDDSLTLISGNTGAGKTTVFDAICCALFGATSGSKGRSFGEMRSKNAEDTDKTEIDFTFELRGQKFRVVRSPKFLKKNNKTESVAKAELTMPDGNILRKVKVVNDKIREILGIGSEEFKQIVMIAQNDFMAMVKDTGGAQEKTFNRIFDATLYKSFSDRVKEELKSSSNEAQKYLSLIKNNVENSGLTYEKSVVNENYIDPGYLLKKVDLERNEKKRSIPKLESLQQDLENKVMRIQLELHDSEEINNKFDQLDNTRKTLKELRDDEEQIKRLEEAKVRAERARDIVSKSHNNWMNYKRLGKGFEDSLKESKGKLEKVKEKLKENERDLETFPRKKLEELQLNYQGLKETIPRYVKLSENLTLLESLNKEKQKAEKGLTSLEEGKQALEDKLNSITIIDDKELDYKEEILNSKKQKFQTDLNLNSEIQKDVEKILDKTKALLKEQEVHRKIKKSQKEFETEAKELNRIFIQNNAAYLAEELEEGKPCPVCGSLEHPNIAVSTEVEVTKEDLDKINKKVKEVQDQYLEQFKLVQEKKNSLLTHLDQIDFKVKNLKETYSKEDSESFNVCIDNLVMPVSANEKVELSDIEGLTKSLTDLTLKNGIILNEELKEQENLIEALKEERDQNNNQKKQKKKAEKDLDNLKTRLEDLKVKFQEIKKSTVQASTLVKSLSETLEYNSLEEAESNLEEKKNALELFKSKLEKLERANNNLKKVKNEELGKYNTTKIQHEENQKRTELSEKKLFDNLKVAEFDSIEDYESSIIEHQKLEQIIKKINSYYDKVKRNEESFRELSQSLENSATRF